MYFFQFAGDVDLTQSVQRLVDDDRMNVRAASDDAPICVLRQRGREARLTLNGEINLIDAGDDEGFAELCLRHVAVATQTSLVFSHDQDEVELLLVFNTAPTPRNVLENGALHTGPDEPQFLQDFDLMQSLLFGEEGDDEPSEAISIEFANRRYASMETLAPLSQDSLVSLQFHVTSTRPNPFANTVNAIDPAIEIIHRPEDEIVGVFARDHEIIIDRTEEYEDGTYGFWGQISGYYDGLGKLNDDDLREAERHRLSRIAKAWVSKHDFEVAIDRDDQATGSMLDDDHPGEWMLVFEWNGGSLRDERRFFPREYD